MPFGADIIYLAMQNDPAMQNPVWAPYSYEKTRGAKNKAYIINVDTQEKMEVQYNPSSFAYERGATYQTITSPGISYPSTSFSSGTIRTFPIDLFMYNKPCTKLILDYINFLGAFLPPEVMHVGFKRPPQMIFCFGYFIRKCVLNSLNIDIQETDENGDPTIAILSMSLTQVGV